MTTPISVQNTTTFTGLVAGTYRVVATQSLGNLSNSQQQDRTIVSQIVLLTYQLSGNPEVCGNDGTITVNVATGTAVSYEIFAGPIIKPLQPSNIFTGLITGQYSVRVFDACGEGVVQTFTVQDIPANLDIAVNLTANIDNCDTTTIAFSINNIPNTTIVYPLQVTISVNPPGGGAPIVYNQTITSSENLYVLQDIILYPNQFYTYDVIVLDGCGNTYIENDVVVYSSTVPILSSENLFCNNYNIHINNALSAVLIEGPLGIPYTLPYTVIPNSSGDLVLFTSIPGTYTFTTVDVCGVVRIQQIILTDDNGLFFAGSLVGCTPGLATLNAGLNLQTAILTQAPTSFTTTLPLNLSSSISSGFFTLVDVPLGTYVFTFTDTCGNSSIKTINANVGYIQNTNIDIIENCGSFDIYLNHTSNSNNNNPKLYWLQQYNPITNQWYNPVNGGVYFGGTLSVVNAIPLVNQATNYNFAFLGHFRILTSFFSATPCINVLHEFDYDGLPKINDVYSFLCNNGTYDVFVDAVGIQPLIYRITQKNGLPFSIQNGNSSVFLGLPAAVYNFQVEDACGNILNSLFEVPRPFNLEITPIGFCNGQPGSLTLPNFSIFQYEWWKDNDTTTLLSTTNTLEFPTFNSVTDVGVYHVRVRYTGNPNSCIDFVLDFTISPNATNPNAGQNNAVTYCGNQGIIDLFSLLQGSYDSGGVWTEVTNSGTLNNSLWNSSAVATGSYQFQYHVEGFCSTSDDAIVAITIKSLPQTPTASVNPINCNSQDLNLFATYIPNAVYNWSGPNNFVSTAQNPVISSASTINSGTYTVGVSENGCQSGLSSVEVVIENLPNFELESYCQNSSYKVIATPENSTNTYNWVGPNNFSSTENPIIITNLDTGSYQVIVTNSEGCSLTKSIEVKSTICEIPNFISPNDDEFNDFFNLAGFDVEKLEVYNRWGKLVYNQNDYIDQWHGQNNDGGILPDSTYYYCVYLRSGEVKHGWVFVVH